MLDPDPEISGGGGGGGKAQYPQNFLGPSAPPPLVCMSLI